MSLYYVTDRGTRLKWIVLAMTLLTAEANWLGV